MMVFGENISQWFELAASVLASIGVGGGIVIGLSSYLGDIWAKRLLAKEQARLNESIEAAKAAYTKLLDAHRSELQQLAADRIDALSRRRDVYAKLATQMRVLVRAEMNEARREDAKGAFLAAYDEGYIWASESVGNAVCELLTVVEKNSKVDLALGMLPINAPAHEEASKTAAVLDRQGRSAYQRCLLEMRKDCGFPNSQVEYRMVTF